MSNLFKNHRRKFAVLTLLLGLGILAVGFVRLPDYTVPMLQGNYAAAATSKYEERFDKDVRRPNLGLGEPSASDKFWEGASEYGLWACDTAIGDRLAAKFNVGLTQFQDGDYNSSIGSLRKAYNACCEKDGAVKPAHRMRAAEIQALIGNAYANLQKTDEAVAAYELSLTLDPTNRTVIYNLERLQDSSGGKGGGEGDKNKKPAGADRTKI